jgi:hypothetical protein
MPSIAPRISTFVVDRLDVARLDPLVGREQLGELGRLSGPRPGRRPAVVAGSSATCGEQGGGAQGWASFMNRVPRKSCPVYRAARVNAR